MHGTLLRASVTALLAAVALASQAATPYQATVFMAPGAQSTSLFGVNNAGAMVGAAKLNGGASIGFVQNAGTTTWLSGPVGAIDIWAMGLSDLGTIVGQYSDTLVDDGEGNLVPGPSKGFLFDGTNYRTLVLAGYTSTTIRGISPNGRYVTGFATTDSGSDGWMLDLNSNTFQMMASGLVMIPQGVTNEGLVVGSRIWEDGDSLRREGFSWQAGAYTAFQLAGQSNSRPRGVNASGVMTGWLLESGQTKAFFGTPSDYSTFQWQGKLTMAQAINDAGLAVGMYDDGGASVGLIFAPVPEPGTYALMLGGLGLLALRTRRAA